MILLWSYKANIIILEIWQQDNGTEIRRSSISGMGFFDNVFKTTTNIDSLSGRDFEFLCASVLRANGFSNVRVTPGSGDFGVDVLAEKGGRKYGIQCKHYSKSVGVKAVQEAFAGKTHYNCDVAMVLTNNYFTQQARTFADESGVILWDRSKLTSLVRTSNLQNQRGIRYSVPWKENRTRGARSDSSSCLGQFFSGIVLVLAVVIIAMGWRDKNESEDSATDSSSAQPTIVIVDADRSAKDETEIRMVIIAKNEANIRKGPGSNNDVVMTAKPGTEFIGTGKSEYAENGGLWYEIYIDSDKTATAWASEQVIQKVEENGE